MISKEKKIKDLVNSKSLENNTTNETTKSQNEMEEELKNEYIHILMNFYSHCCEIDPVCKASIFKSSVGNFLTMCFSKDKKLYKDGKNVVWCSENCLKELYAYTFLKEVLIIVEYKFLDEKEFDKDYVYLQFKDFDIFKLAYDYVCELFKLNE
jgi:hypothetical protein